MMRALVPALVAAALAAACSKPAAEPLTLDGNILTVDNRSDQEWKDVEIWLNTYYRLTIDTVPPKGRVQAPLDNFVAGFGQRFQFRRTQIRDLQLTAKLPDGRPIEIKKTFRASGLGALKGGT